MSEAAHALGKGGSLIFRGQRYGIAPLNLDMIAMLTTWLENRAWEAVERTRSTTDPEVYRERHDAISKLIASGAFEYGTEMAAKACRTMPAIKYEMFLRLQLAPENKNIEITERLASDIIDERMQDAIARMRQADADPNPAAPDQPGQSPPNPPASDTLPPSSSASPGASDPGKSDA